MESAKKNPKIAGDNSDLRWNFQILLELTPIFAFNIIKLDAMRLLNKGTSHLACSQNTAVTGSFFGIMNRAFPSISHQSIILKR